MSIEKPEPYPLITIGFTCFNAKDSITYAVESAQNQTWPNFEILIVDDGSQDGSLDVVRALMSKDDRIRLVALESNKGTAVARNTIAQNAKGQFLAFFDDDDISAPERIEKQYHRLTEYEKEHNTRLVYCYCDRQVITKKDNTIDHTGYGIGRQAPEPYGTAVADIILWKPAENNASNNQMGSGTMMMRTDSFQQTGYFDPQFRRSAELDLAVRAALSGGHFISVPEYLLTQYKTHTSDKSGRKPLEFSLTLKTKHKAYLRKKHVFLAAIFLAYARFYGTQNKRCFSRFFVILACLASPDKILINRLRNRFSSSR